MSQSNTWHVSACHIAIIQHHQNQAPHDIKIRSRIFKSFCCLNFVGYIETGFKRRVFEGVRTFGALFDGQDRWLHGALLLHSFLHLLVWGRIIFLYFSKNRQPHARDLQHKISPLTLSFGSKSTPNTRGMLQHEWILTMCLLSLTFSLPDISVYRRVVRMLP